MSENDKRKKLRDKKAEKLTLNECEAANEALEACLY